MTLDLTKPIRFKDTDQWEVKYLGVMPDGQHCVALRSLEHPGSCWRPSNATYHLSTLEMSFENLPEPAPRRDYWMNVYSPGPGKHCFGPYHSQPEQCINRIDSLGKMQLTYEGDALISHRFFPKDQYMAEGMTVA